MDGVHGRWSSLPKTIPWLPAVIKVLHSGRQDVMLGARIVIADGTGHGAVGRTAQAGAGA
jgi:hypothetical protein